MFSHKQFHTPLPLYIVVFLHLLQKSQSIGLIPDAVRLTRVLHIPNACFVSKPAGIASFSPSAVLV